MEVIDNNTNWALANTNSRFNAKWELTTSQWVVLTHPTNNGQPGLTVPSRRERTRQHYSNPTSSFKFPHVSLWTPTSGEVNHCSITFNNNFKRCSPFTIGPNNHLLREGLILREDMSNSFSVLWPNRGRWTSTLGQSVHLMLLSSSQRHEHQRGRLFSTRSTQ